MLLFLIRFFLLLDLCHSFYVSVTRCVPIDNPPSCQGNILSSESRLLRLRSPAYVFGDFHGNMADLLTFARTMWPLGMHLTPGTFLFLGDYVDRGMFGLELLAYIFAQKIMLPEKVFLLRGNHEVKAVNVSFLPSLHPRASINTTERAASSASSARASPRTSPWRSGLAPTRCSTTSLWPPRSTT